MRHSEDISIGLWLLMITEFRLFANRKVDYLTRHAFAPLYTLAFSCPILL